MAFVKAISLDQLWVGDMRAVVIDGRRVVVVHLDSGVHAYEDRCSHLGIPLSRGCLDGDVLVCSAHHYQYDARNGDGINPCTVKLEAFPVQIRGDDVFIDASPPAPREATIVATENRAMDHTQPSDLVGPVLVASDDARAVIEAIEDSNQGVEVQDRRAYLRVLVPRRCEVTRAAIERALGREFRLPGDLEPLMPSFKGVFTVTEERAIWEVGGS